MIGLIVLIGIVLFFMYGTVGKKIKDYIPESDLSKPNEDNPWDLEEALKPVVDRPLESVIDHYLKPTIDKPFSYDDDIVDEENAVMSMPVAVNSFSEYDMPSQSVLHNGDKAIRQGVASELFANKFDLKRAIIYSEIMCPKFKEY